MFHGMNEHGLVMGWGWIIILLILIIVVWFIIRMVSRNDQLQESNKTPLDILKERYAKGEIDEMEFEERKKRLL